MKQETKNVIEWLRVLVKCANVETTQDKEMYEHALHFLDSLPELEKQLGRGGFIPDMNKTPCKHGDKIRIAETNGSYIIGSEYKLNWNKDDFYFAFLNADNKEVGYPNSDVKIIKVE